MYSPLSRQTLSLTTLSQARSRLEAARQTRDETWSLCEDCMREADRASDLLALDNSSEPYRTSPSATSGMDPANGTCLPSESARAEAQAEGEWTSTGFDRRSDYRETAKLRGRIGSHGCGEEKDRNADALRKQDHAMAVQQLERALRGFDVAQRRWEQAEREVGLAERI